MEKTTKMRTFKRGDMVFIHFDDIAANWMDCYALCEYRGRRNGKYIFESDMYGWKYILDAENGTIINDFNPEKTLYANNNTGWMNHLPK